MIDNKLPIVDHLSNAYRDPVSGAIIMNDHDGFMAAKQRKNFHERQLQNEKNIQELQGRLDKIDRNIELIVNKLF